MTADTQQAADVAREQFIREAIDWYSDTQLRDFMDSEGQEISLRDLLRHLTTERAAAEERGRDEAEQALNRAISGLADIRAALRARHPPISQAKVE